MERTEWYPILWKKYPDFVTFSEIEHTFHRMLQIFNEHERIAISVSGGSDSDCIIHLVCTYFPEYLDKCKFVFSDTGLELDATKRHLDEQEKKYGITIDRVRGMSMVTAVRKYGLPILSKYKANIIRAYIRGNPWAVKRIYPSEELLAKLRNDQKFSENQIEMIEHIKRSGILISADCCVHCKKKPLHAYEKEMGCDLYVTGERKAEGGQRSIKQHSCFVEKKGADKYMPLFQWSDETKRQFKQTEGIRFSDCYEVWGMKRTGCTGCPFNINIADDLQRFYQFEPRMYQACMKVFGQSYELMDRFNCRRKKCIHKVIQFQLRFDEGGETDLHTVTELDKMQIINLWLNHNYKRDEIKEILQVSGIVVERTINEYTSTGAHEPPKDMLPPARAMMIPRRGRKVVTLDAGD